MLKRLNTICYTVCIVCIVAGVILGLAIVWVNMDDEFLWKGLLSVLIFFLAATLTLGVNKMLERSGNSGGID